MALADWTSIFTGGAGAAVAALQPKTQCVEAANKSASVIEIENKTDDLVKNWHPTGFYLPAEVRQLVGAISGATTAARLALAQAPNPGRIYDVARHINQARDYLDRNDERAKLYMNGAEKAASNGQALDAPGLKLWVTNSMVNIASAYATVATLQCEMRWMDHAASLIGAIWNVAKRIAGVILKAGETALQVVEDIWKLYPYIKWGALGIGLLFVGAFVRQRFLKVWESKPKPVSGRRLAGRR